MPTVNDYTHTNNNHRAKFKIDGRIDAANRSNKVWALGYKKQGEAKTGKHSLLKIILSF